MEKAKATQAEQFEDATWRVAADQSVQLDVIKGKVAFLKKAN